MHRHIYFISHPNVVISKDIPVPQRPLSELGRKRMKVGLKQPWTKSITSIYCSNEQKAMDGAEILSEYLSLTPTYVQDLGENDRSSTGFLPSAEFEQAANLFFAHPTESIRGWEKATDAQDRIHKAITRAAESDATNGSIAIVSHGAVGTLLYCQLSKLKISRQWDQPPNGGGNYFHFQPNPTEVKCWWKVYGESAA